MNRIRKDSKIGKDVRSQSKKTPLFIKTNIFAQNKNQLEIEFEYSLNPEAKLGLLGGDQSFDVEAYFFFPPRMSITTETYSKEEFYKDINHTLRLRAPSLGFKALIGDKPSKKGSPLEEIEKILKKLEKNYSKSSMLRGIDCARVYACSFSEYLLSKLEKKLKKIKSFRKNKEIKDVVLNFKLMIESFETLFSKNLTLMTQWEKNVELSTNLSAKKKELNKLTFEMKLASEYCHYRTREALAKIFYEIQKIDIEELEPLIIIFKKKMKVWIRWQLMKTKKLSSLSLSEKSSSTDKEKYLYRLHFLKKRMWQVLYLQLEVRRAFKLRKQFSYMFAAGLAALWALFADVMIRIKLLDSATMSFDFSRLLGTSGFIIVTSFVLAYILKDRIKELGRVKLSKGVFSNSPDFNEQIWWSDSEGNRHQIGILKEWMSFIKNENDVPEEIKILRNEWVKEDLYVRDKIICYRKNVVMSPKNFSEVPFVPFSTKEIMRLDVSNYITKLDSPKSNYIVMNSECEASSVLLPKTYHLDLLLKFSYKDFRGELKMHSHKFIRLVLDKEGIVRIEKKNMKDI